MPGKHWSEKEIETLTTLWMTDLRKNVANKVGRTVDACDNKVIRIARKDRKFSRILAEREPAYRDLVDDNRSSCMVECRGRPENRNF